MKQASVRDNCIKDLIKLENELKNCKDAIQRSKIQGMIIYATAVVSQIDEDDESFPGA